MECHHHQWCFFVRSYDVHIILSLCRGPIMEVAKLMAATFTAVELNPIDISYLSSAAPSASAVVVVQGNYLIFCALSGKI